MVPDEKKGYFFLKRLGRPYYTPLLYKVPLHAPLTTIDLFSSRVRQENVFPHKLIHLLDVAPD